MSRLILHRLSRLNRLECRLYKCILCGENTDSTQLEFSTYVGHRKCIFRCLSVLDFSCIDSLFCNALQNGYVDVIYRLLGNSTKGCFKFKAPPYLLKCIESHVSCNIIPTILMYVIKYLLKPMYYESTISRFVYDTVIGKKISVSAFSKLWSRVRISRKNYHDLMDYVDTYGLNIMSDNDLEIDENPVKENMAKEKLRIISSSIRF